MLVGAGEWGGDLGDFGERGRIRFTLDKAFVLVFLVSRPNKAIGDGGTREVDRKVCCGKTTSYTGDQHPGWGRCKSMKNWFTTGHGKLVLSCKC